MEADKEMNVVMRLLHADFQQFKFPSQLPLAPYIPPFSFLPFLGTLSHLVH